MAKESQSRRHFVLVHGTCHGAWSWYKTAVFLESLGHKVTALDLAASGLDPKQAHEVKSLAAYTQPLLDFLASLPAEEKVILVGHSMGGISTTMAMERFPKKIAVAVFIAAYMPGPDLPYLFITQQNTPSLDYFLDSEFIHNNGPENPPTAVRFGNEYARARMYQHSPPEDVKLATFMMRPAPLFNSDEALAGSELTKENYGTIPRVYVICAGDIGLHADTQRWQVEKNPPELVKVLEGADHFPMCSKPEELHAILKEVAEKF